MSASIVWAANGHELLKCEAGEDERALKQRIHDAFGIPAGAYQRKGPHKDPNQSHNVCVELCCTAAARST